jgi:hypothetical protein
MVLSKEAIAQWHHFYGKLICFQEVHGHCNVLPDSREDRELAKWVLIQKRAKHQLSKEFRDKLKAIGFDFSIDRIYYWYEQFDALERFFSKFGHAHVPATDHQYASLHEWLITQVRNKNALTAEQTAKLDSLGVHWEFNDVRDWRWHEMYIQLKDFYEEYGHCNVPQKWKINKQLSSWVSVQRRRVAEGNMKKNRKEKLDALGFVWDFREVYKSQWEDKFDRLVAFKDQYGHCKVPLTYPDQHLAGWVDRQRTLKTNGRLPADREQKLNEIGFIWDCTVLQEEFWQEKFDQLEQYKKQYGDCQVPVNWRENPSLGTWVSTQRTLAKKGKLDPVKKKKLEEMGFVWNKEAWKLQLRKYDEQWNRNFQRLKAYKRQYGDIQVSVRIDWPLERWTCIQRREKQTGKLAAWKIKKLEQIGFAWNIHESYWMKMYDQLILFKEKYGHTRVPYYWNENRRLGQWVSRTRRKVYELTEEQTDLLNRAGFRWNIIRKNPVPWTSMFQLLIKFKEKYGDTRVPTKWERDKKLGKWVSRMRSDQDKLDPERKRMLENINFDWQKRKGGRPAKRMTLEPNFS